MQRTKKNRKEERRKEGGKEGRKDTSNEHLSNIYNPSDEHQSQKDRTSVGNQSEIYRISIRRKSFENQLENNKIHAQLNQNHTISMKTQMLIHCNPTRKSANKNRFKKVASFRFNQKKSSRNSQQLNLQNEVIQTVAIPLKPWRIDAQCV